MQQSSEQYGDQGCTLCSGSSSTPIVGGYRCEKFFDAWQCFFREDPGQDLVEYTLLLAFLAMVAIGLMSQAGVSIQGPWNTATTTLAAAGGTSTSSPSTPSTPPPNRGDDDDHGH
jgi:Flp pilus assembly pilin Flp